jgi:hypothetical protein
VTGTARRLGLALVLAAAAGVAGPAAGSSAAQSPPEAQHFAGVPTVGPLFLPGAYPGFHSCTAGVVRSTAGNVIVTAAHCVTGTGVGYRFAPGYDNGATPYGVWSVTGAYGAPAWMSRQDPHRDWAFLTVARQQVDGHSRSLQSVTGAHRLGRTAIPGDRVKVIGYALGSGDQALRCTTSVNGVGGYPEFDCDGYVGGTSGSPWLRKSSHGVVISGVIGGLHQGGCTPASSYSPPLGKPAHRALARAASGTGPDTFPAPGSDGCT